MLVRFGNTLFPIIFFIVLGFVPDPAQAGRSDPAAMPAAVAGMLCIDPWHRTQPCRSTSLRNNSTAPADRWWSNLWATAGEVAAAPVVSGKRVSCGNAFDRNPLIKLDFTSFQLNMDVDLDPAEEHFDALRIAYRSCWR
jgi:hypothetical protein